MKKDRARARLRELADRLREQFPVESSEDNIVPQGVWISLDDAVWLEQAIRRYLVSNGKLEQALGLTGSRGAPRGPANALIARAFAEDPDATQEAIALSVQEKHKDDYPDALDAKAVRRALFKSPGTLTTEAVEALAEVLTRRLGAMQGQK